MSLKNIIACAVLFLLVLCPNAWSVEIVNCPDSFKVDGYRLYFGESEYDWQDIGFILNSNLEATFSDESDITKVICAEYDEAIYIQKKFSSWAFFDYTDIMNGRIILYAKY